MFRNLRFMSVAMVIVFAFSAIAFGQGTTGSIEGTVTDQTGAVIPGATVIVENSGATTGFKRTVSTDQNGYFILARVAPGTYRVSVNNSGFKTSTVTVSVAVDKASPANAVLEPGSGPVTVDVVGGDSAVTIDQGNTNVDTNIGKKLIENLPKGTQFTTLLKIAPNVRPESLSGGFQIDGASGSENVFVIDGQEVTNFRTGVLNTNNNLPFELLQEVQIKSTGFFAEYGGATGGVINVVTIGGNNQFRGNLGISFEPQALQGGARLVLNRYASAAGATEYFNPGKAGGTAYYPTAALSGPIVKDKLWFSAIYAPQIFDYTRDVPFYTDGSTDPVTRLPIPSSNPTNRSITETQSFDFHRKTEEAFFRLDAQPSEKLRMFGTFLWNPIIDQGNLPGGTYGLSNSIKAGPLLSQGGIFRTQSDLLNNQGGRQNGNSINGQVTYTPTDKLVLNFRVGRNFLNEKLGSYGVPTETRFLCSSSGDPATIPGGTAAAGCSQGYQNIPNNFEITYDVSTRTTFDADAALIGVNAGGRHNFKFGYQYNRLFNTVDDGYRNTGVVVLFYGLRINSVLGTPPSGPLCTAVGQMNCVYGSGYLQRFASLGEASSANQGYFVQDSWQINNRVTLNLGVRAEVEDVPSFSATGDSIKFGLGDKIAPRLGIAFDVTGDGKTKIFASYGWFYDRFKYELPRGSFGGDFFRRDYFELTSARGSNFSVYSRANILGTVPDVAGGNCPGNPGPYMPLGNGFSVCQLDFRIPTNIPGADVFDSGAVDPDIKAARQSEYTIGFERSLASDTVLAARYTHKQLDRAIEDVGVFNASGSEAYVIGNPGIGLVCQISTDGGQPCIEAQREYDAFEIRVDKRATKWFFNSSYTFSKLFGNYSGLASSDEAGRTSPNVSRLFDLPYAAFTGKGVPNNGRLATDRPHVFKAFAGYSHNWGGNNINVTTISGFTTAQSGTPLSTIISVYSLSPFFLNERGDLGRSESFTESDLSVSHRYKFGRDARFSFEPFISIRNLFDEANVLGVQATKSTTNFSAASLQAGGCPAAACSGRTGVINTIVTGGGVKQYVDAYITANGQRNDFNLANNFQGGREVRFGARFYF